MTVRHRCKVALDAAGIARRPFHSLPHAFATSQHESGGDISTISKLLGHASISATTDVYGHLSPRTQGRAADWMDAIVNGQGVRKR